MRSTPDTPTAPAGTPYAPVQASAGAAIARQPMPSEMLLQGQKLVEISHNGAIYRLQATKLGKLILTK